MVKMSADSRTVYYLSPVMRKQDFGIWENKDANQLCIGLEISSCPLAHHGLNLLGAT